MLRRIFLVFLVFCMFGCSPFKGGRFYSYTENLIGGSKYFLHGDGNYECYFSSEGTNGLAEKGHWINHHDKIIIIIDTLFDLSNKKGTVVTIKKIFKKRVFNRNELVLKKKFDGKIYTVVLKPM